MWLGLERLKKQIKMGYNIEVENVTFGGYDDQDLRCEGNVLLVLWGRYENLSTIGLELQLEGGQYKHRENQRDDNIYQQITQNVLNRGLM